MIKAQKLRTSIIFLLIAMFAGIVGVLATNTPKIESGINIGYTEYEARVQDDDNFIYFKKLSEAVNFASSGQEVQIINPVELDENIVIDKNITFNSMVMQGTPTHRSMAVSVGADGGFTISNNAKVNLGSLAGGLTFAPQSTDLRTKSLFTLDEGIELTITGGEFSGFQKEGNGAVFNIINGTLNIYGGKFNDNKVEYDDNWNGYGGVIYIENGEVNIYGGEFKGNKAEYGGAIATSYDDNSTINVYSGIFKENSSEYDGGVFFIYGDHQLGEWADESLIPNLNIYGGQFIGNSQIEENGTYQGDWGGVIYAQFAVIDISGGSFIENIGVDGAVIGSEEGFVKLTVSGGNFIGNTTSSGGVIYNIKRLTISGGTFKNNKALGNEWHGGIGGVIHNSSDGVIDINGGTFENNTAALGGAIYNNGVLNISKSPYIEDEIYLATSTHINFVNEVSFVNLNVKLEDNSLGKQVISSSVEQSKDLINKINVINKGGYELVQLNDNYYLGYYAKLDTQGGIIQDEVDKGWGWMSNSNQVTYQKGFNKAGATLGSLPIPAKEGYIFDGWYTGENGGGSPVAENTIISNSTIYYAKWEEAVTEDTNFFSIGENYYETLSQAVDAVPENDTTTIKVLKNVYQAEGITISSSKKIILTSDESVTIYRAIGIGNSSLITNQGELTISGHITIDGQKDLDGMTFASNGGAINNSGTLNLNGHITFTNNKATGSSNTDGGGAIYNTGTLNIGNSEGESENITVTFTENTTNRRGGAIYNYSNAAFNIEGNANVEFKNNSANNGGGAINNGLSGSNVTFNIEENANVEFNNNSANNGGAINNYATLLDINGNVEFVNNSATNHGGAIYNSGEGTKLNINGDVEFRNNSSNYGGAISNNSSATINIGENANVEFINNSVDKSFGGAIYNNSSATINIEANAKVEFINNSAGNRGGAIYNNDNATIKIEANGNVNFINNSASLGGAIFNQSATLNINGKVEFIRNKANSGQAIHNNNGTVTGATGENVVYVVDTNAGIY